MGRSMRRLHRAPFRRFVKVFAAVAALLVASTLNTHLALAQDEPTCPDTGADTQGCIAQDGDNTVHVHEGGSVAGGDAVGGSQVIGAAGSGPTAITANNNSQFADAQGGDASAHYSTTIKAGPHQAVSGAATTVRSSTSGTAVLNQTNSPQVTLTLTQFSAPTGTTFVSNTAAPVTTLSSTQSVDGTATLAQAPTSTATAGPQIFAPSSIPFATGSTAVTNTQSVTNTATLDNSATLTGTGPVTQTSTQSAASSVTQSGAPALATGTNTADPTITIDTTQTGSATTDPRATATAGPTTVRGQLTDIGDNNVSVFEPFDLTAGDGVAGSEVIGAANSGAATINASNTSKFASSQGGDASGESTFLGDAGPNLDITGPTVTVIANATGTATQTQTSSPTLAFTATQTAVPSATSTTTNSAAPVTSLEAVQAVTGSSDVSQTPGSHASSGEQLAAPAFGGGGSASNTQLQTNSSGLINSAGATGTGPVDQTIVQDGGSALATQAVVGDAVVGQAPVSAAAGGTQTFVGAIPDHGSASNLQTQTNSSSLTNSATALGTGPVDQTIDQSATNAVTQSGAGATATALNDASPTIAFVVTQTGTVSTDPVATATSTPHSTTGIIDEADVDNRIAVFHDLTATGGDGVAGSQIIGDAASGPSTINATNSSEFSDSTGGDAQAHFSDDETAGPDLTVTDGPITVTANATGVATLNQTASPTLTVTISQTAAPVASSTTNNTAAPQLNLSATQSVTGASSISQTPGSAAAGGAQLFDPLLFGTSAVTNTQTQTNSSTVTNSATVTGTGPVSQSSTQTGSSLVNQTGNNPATATSNNSATTNYTFTITQSGTVSTNPVATATSDAAGSSSASAGDGVSSISTG